MAKVIFRYATASRHVGLTLAWMQLGLDGLTPDQRDEFIDMSSNPWVGSVGNVPEPRIEVGTSGKRISAVPATVWTCLFDSLFKVREDKWRMPSSMQMRCVLGSADRVDMPEFGQSVQMRDYSMAVMLADISPVDDLADIGRRVIEQFGERLICDCGDCHELDGTISVGRVWLEQLAPHVMDWTDEIKSRRVLCYGVGAELAIEPFQIPGMANRSLVYWRCRLGGLIV